MLIGTLLLLPFLWLGYRGLNGLAANEETVALQDEILNSLRQILRQKKDEGALPPSQEEQ